MVDKGQSPFYPGQPVPVELFVGREKEIERIITRGVGQVERGKPVSIFVQGEYGIGKSSIARYVQLLAADKHGLLPIYASLSPSNTPSDFAVKIVESTLHSGLIHATRGERIKGWLAKYIGKQELLGFTVNLEALRSDADKIASVHGLLGFLAEALEKAGRERTSGIFLVLDEINGLANQPWFAQTLKGLVDTNALSAQPLPLLLMICGTEEKRRRLIENHQPVERIFDVIDIERLSKPEMKEFFRRAFESAGMTIIDEAMDLLIEHSAGFPKLMHLIGDWAYWTDQDLTIDTKDALVALVAAADDFGKKYVDQQIVAALRSQDYRSILRKISKLIDRDSFSKKEIETQLDDSERKKLGNFLQKMKTLGVLRSGDVQGEWVFNVSLVRLYLFLQTVESDTSR
jgi:AAA ATPase domain